MPSLVRWCDFICFPNTQHMMHAIKNQHRNEMQKKHGFFFVIISFLMVVLQLVNVISMFICKM
jgi:hypothetical protein